MTIPLNVSVFLSGFDLTYSADDLPPGLTIDPDTGVINGVPTIEGVSTVSLTVSNGAGSVTTSFTWTIEAAVSESLPANTSSPFIVGAAEVGSVLTVDPGVWTGEPAPTFSNQWMRGASNIAGATGETYIPVAADSEADIKARVTATNSEGSASADSPLVAITYAAPTAMLLLPDVTVAEGEAITAIQTAGDFTGDDLTFSATSLPAGLAIDGATGAISGAPTTSATAHTAAH